MIEEFKSIFKAVFTLRFKNLENNRLFKIGIVGVIGFIVQAAVFEVVGLWLELVRPSTAALIGAETAIIFTFTLNNIFSFSEQSIPFSRLMVKKFFQFNLAVAGSLGIQWLTVRSGEWLVGDQAFLLRGFNILGVLIGFIFNYRAYTKVVWSKKTF